MKRLLAVGLVLILTVLLLMPAAPVAHAMTATEVEAGIYTYLTEEMGLNTAAACGALANIYAECRFDPNDVFIEKDGRESYGICQWNGSRRAALEQYCAEHGYDWSTLEGQLHFMQHELETYESSAYATFKDVPNTAEGARTAGYNWAQNYERCSEVYEGVHQWDYRADLAKNTYWPKYKDAIQSGYLGNCTQFPSYCNVEVTKSSAPIWSLPCNSTTDASSKKIETASTGTVYTATKLILNSQNNYWYRVISKSGATGYLFAGNCSYLSKINDLSADNVTAPPTIDKGKSWAITGTVTTSYSDLSKVAVFVYPGTNTSGTSETGDEVNASGQSYYLPGSALDQKVVFGILGAGRHTYVLSAKSISYYATSSTTRAVATNTKQLFTSSFNIRAASQNYSNYLPVGQLSQLSTFEQYISAKGWAYDDDHINFSLTIYVKINGTTWPYVTTAGDLNNDVPIDNKYKGFNGFYGPFDPGDYTVEVFASDVDEFGNSTGNDVSLGSASITILPPHTHQYDSLIIDPTCDEQGYTLHQCSCGECYKDNYIAATGHDISGYWSSVDEEPTMTTGGIVHWYCSNCSYSEGQEIEALSTASYEKTTIRAASCIEEGIIRYRYKYARYDCDMFFDVPSPKTTHNYFDSVKAATCTEQGYTEHVCEICGDTVIDTYTDALGHQFENGVCVRCGAKDTSIKKGDLNGDGEVTSADAVMMARYLADFIELNPSQFQAADLNQDGDVTSADAVMMARFLAGLLESFN